VTRLEHVLNSVFILDQPLSWCLYSTTKCCRQYLELNKVIMKKLLWWPGR